MSPHHGNKRKHSGGIQKEMIFQRCRPNDSETHACKHATQLSLDLNQAVVYRQNSNRPFSLCMEHCSFTRVTMRLRLRVMVLEVSNIQYLEFIVRALVVANHVRKGPTHLPKAVCFEMFVFGGGRRHILIGPHNVWNSVRAPLPSLGAPQFLSCR